VMKVPKKSAETNVTEAEATNKNTEDPPRAITSREICVSTSRTRRQAKDLHTKELRLICVGTKQLHTTTLLTIATVNAADPSVQQCHRSSPPNRRPLRRSQCHLSSSFPKQSLHPGDILLGGYYSALLYAH